MLMQQYNINMAMNAKRVMRDPHRDYMASLLPNLGSNNRRSGDCASMHAGLPAIPESRQAFTVSIFPDNAKPLAQSASMTFQTQEDVEQIKFNRWASVPSTLKDEAQGKLLNTTTTQRKPSRSHDDYTGQRSSVRKRVTSSDTNTSPRVNDSWDVHRNDDQQEKLGSSKAKSLVHRADASLFDVERIVQGLAAVVPASIPARKEGKNGRGASKKINTIESTSFTPLSSPTSSLRIKRSQRLLGDHPNSKQSTLSPRYPLRQTSDPDGITDGPRRQLRQSIRDADVSDASAKTI